MFIAGYQIEAITIATLTYASAVLTSTMCEKDV